MLLLRRRYSDSTLCLPNHSHHSLSLSLSITLSSRTYFLSIYYSTTYSLLYLHIPIIFLLYSLHIITCLSSYHIIFSLSIYYSIIHSLYISTYLLYFSYSHCTLPVFLPTTSFSLSTVIPFLSISLVPFTSSPISVCLSIYVCLHQYFPFCIFLTIPLPFIQQTNTPITLSLSHLLPIPLTLHDSQGLILLLG